MRNLLRNWIAVSGSTLLAVALAGAMPALADDGNTTANQRVQQQPQYQQMQARMQAMHALMTQIDQTTDPAVRQRLMEEEYQLMREQMGTMGMMNGGAMGGAMMGNGMMGGGMMGGGMYGGAMMQPQTNGPTN